MPTPEIVATERLVSAPLDASYRDPWMEFITGAHSLDHLPFVDATPEGCDWWIARQMERYERDGCGLMALHLRETGDLVGQCGLLRQVVEGVPELEVGYHLLPRSRGRGYATEAARGFIDHARDAGMAGSVVSIIHVGNLASQRVADRNGLARERRITAYGEPHWLYRTAPFTES